MLQEVVRAGEAFHTELPKLPPLPSDEDIRKISNLEHVRCEAHAVPCTFLLRCCFSFKFCLGKRGSRRSEVLLITATTSPIATLLWS